MKLDPAERRFTPPDERAFYIRFYFDLVEFPPCKELSQFPGALSQRPHSRLSAVLAKQRRRLRKVIPGVSAKLVAAKRRAPKPPTGPEGQPSHPGEPSRRRNTPVAVARSRVVRLLEPPAATGG